MKTAGAMRRAGLWRSTRGFAPADLRGGACRLRTLGFAILLLAAAGSFAAEAASRRFSNGFPADPKFFPIGVWLQSPRNARPFAAMGINIFVGLWNKPNYEDLARLDNENLFAIVGFNPDLRALRNAHVIRAWMHQDEPDNAQSDGKGGWGPCIKPPELKTLYDKIRSTDRTRPVLLNFGQAVANPAWYGRGTECSQISPQDYYTAASHHADIVSFDIYPAVETTQAHVTGKLELVGQGVRNLRRWSRPGQPVWAFIETTHINNPSRRALPAEIQSEVWMALIAGAQGIVYFVHEWQPSFREDGVLEYADNVAKITRISAQIKALAPILNSASLVERVAVEAPVEIATMVKRDRKSTYIFAVNMTKQSGTARFKLSQISGKRAQVYGERRALPIADGTIEDDFPEYGVRIYQIPAAN